jgi:hypothetical protein
MLEKDCRRILNLNIPFETIYFNLPEEYCGYKSKQLIELYGLSDIGKNLDAPESMILAMGQLLRQYRITPIHQRINL